MSRQAKTAPPEFLWADTLGFFLAILSLLLAGFTLLNAIRETPAHSIMGPLNATHQILMLSSLVVGAVAFGTSLLDHKVRTLSLAGILAILLQSVGLTSGATCCGDLLELINPPDAASFAGVTAWSYASLPFLGNMALTVLYPRNRRARLTASNLGSTGGQTLPS